MSANVLTRNAPIWEDRRRLWGSSAGLARRAFDVFARKRPAPAIGLEFSPVLFGNWKRLMDLKEALKRLATSSAEAARVAELKLISGLTEAQIAEELNLPVRTVKRNWCAARAWLHQEFPQ